MAYALFNEHHDLYFVSKDIDQLTSQYPGYGIYQNRIHGSMVEISNSDFDLVCTGQKKINYDGTNISFEDTTEGLVYTNSRNDLKLRIDNIIFNIDRVIKGYSNTNFGLELTAYKNLLQGIDIESIAYPMNVTLEKYLKDQGHPIISTLQVV